MPADLHPPRKFWYFSTMAPRVSRRQPPARVVPFQRAKYGRELLIDAAFLSDMPGFEASPRPHRLSFFDMLLVTRGRGRFELDGQVHRVAPGRMFFTRPGQVRRWDVQDLDGACLFFTAEFIQEAFSDERFLDRFAFFRPEGTGMMALSRAERRRFLRSFSRMAGEIGALRSDAPHLLRALLYELLVLINRWYFARHPGASAGRAPAAVERFRLLLERDFARCHRVAEYANRVGLTPGHLNALCRSHMGRSAGTLIRQRLTLEARRRLLYTDTPIFVVASDLGFHDPAYFARFFRREAGTSPRALRRNRQAAIR